MSAVQHPSISLCLSKSGEAAILYVSPKGVNTVVARGPYGGLSTTRQDAGSVVALIGGHWGAFGFGRTHAIQDTLTRIAGHEGWAVTITGRQLAQILSGEEVSSNRRASAEGKEVTRHAG